MDVFLGGIIMQRLISHCVPAVALLAMSLTTPANCRQLRAASFDVRPDVVYGHKDGMALTYDVFTPKENAKGLGLLFMVSGGWVSTWVPPQQLGSTMLAPLLQQGYTVFAVRHGSSPKYVVPEVANDVKQALKHIHKNADDYSVDKSRLGVFGFSAGGHLSLILGTQSNHVGHAEQQPRVAAVVAVCPPTDLELALDSEDLVRRFPALKFKRDLVGDVSPLRHVTSDDAATLLIHGDQDDLVPISQSQDIAAALEKNQVKHELMTIEGAGHGFDPESRKLIFQGMVQWFDQHLHP
ncbi:MAG: alpha/beta hydrolase [Pirellulaceae bacterium]|nr:alpha/beta hydrolase [Pirellulaceae bacterium]